LTAHHDVRHEPGAPAFADQFLTHMLTRRIRIVTTRAECAKRYSSRKRSAVTMPG